MLYIILLVSVIGVLFNESIYKPAKKWFVAGLLGMGIVGALSTKVPMGRYILGLLVLFCIALMVVGAETYRRHYK